MGFLPMEERQHRMHRPALSRSSLRLQTHPHTHAQKEERGTSSGGKKSRSSVLLRGTNTIFFYDHRSPRGKETKKEKKKKGNEHNLSRNSLAADWESKRDFVYNCFPADGFRSLKRNWGTLGERFTVHVAPRRPSIAAT